MGLEDFRLDLVRRKRMLDGRQERMLAEGPARDGPA